jgi:hypothetical protein
LLSFGINFGLVPPGLSLPFPIHVPDSSVGSGRALSGQYPFYILLKHRNLLFPK